MKSGRKGVDKRETSINWGDILLSEIERFEVKRGKVAFWFLSDSCFVIKTPGQIIYTDPFFGGSFPEHGVMRMTCLPLEPNLIKKADIVLCTHEHADHCHRESLLPFLSNTKATFVAPKPAANLMREWDFSKDRIKEVKSGDKVSFGDVTIYATDTNDPTSDGAVTYVIQSGGVTLFHTGDSWYFDGFLKIGKLFNIDVAFINFGFNPPGKQWYLTPSDFLRTARELRAKKAVPMHWDIWRVTYLDPIVLKDFLKHEPSRIDVLIMRMGDRVIYPF